MMPTQNPMGFMNPMNYGMFLKPGDQNMFMMNSKNNYLIKKIHLRNKVFYYFI